MVVVNKPKRGFWLAEGPNNFTRRATSGKLNLPVVRLIVLVCAKWQGQLLSVAKSAGCRWGEVGIDGDMVPRSNVYVNWVL